MKYTQEEQLEEIMARGKTFRKKRGRRITGILTATSTALIVALVICMGSVGDMGHAGTVSAYGSFLLAEEAGGYVLVAVLAFALGAVVTGLICRHRRMQNQP